MEESKKAKLARMILNGFVISHEKRKAKYPDEAKDWLIARLEDFLRDDMTGFI